MRRDRAHVTAALLLASLWTPGCGDPRVVALSVTAGQEEDVFSSDPAITDIEISAIDPEGLVVAEVTTEPGGSFDLGELPETTQLHFELTGTTADGTLVARGRSIDLVIGAVASDGALDLFIQRLGVFARPPGELVRSHVHAPGAVFGQQFLLLTGGDSAVGADGNADPAFPDLYDMLTLQPFVAAVLPRAARSMVPRATSLLLIDDEGATDYDLSNGASVELDAPDGLDAFADVSGGIAVETPVGLGRTLIVGATRDADPTDAILVVNLETGATSALKLSQKRAGASALYVDGVGVVVIGGSNEGPAVEIIEDDGVTVTSLPYPADPTTGAAAVVTAEQKIALIGGRIEGTGAETREIDLRCVSAPCEARIIAEPLGEIASRGRAFAVGNGVLVIGDADPDGDLPGETLAFLADLGEPRIDPLPLRQRRHGATPIPTPNGLLSIVGGVTPSGGPAGSVELLFPE